MVEEPIDDGVDGTQSEAPSNASELNPEDWNSEDEPPEDHVGDEQICSRDGRVKKFIRKVGKGLQRPGQYDVVRMRWTQLQSEDDVQADREPKDTVSNVKPGSAVEVVEVRMGEDELPLAVEFALKTMRLGEEAEVRGPSVYATRASPLCGRKLRDQSGRLPRAGKVPRKLRFLPAAPRHLAAQAKAAVKGEKKDGETARPFRAKVELLGIDAVHMLTEDRCVSKSVLRKGRGLRTPRLGDIIKFAVAQFGSAEESSRYTMHLGGDSKIPGMPGLEHVLLSMKEGEQCIANLLLELCDTRVKGETVDSPADAGGVMCNAAAATSQQPCKGVLKAGMWRYDPPEERNLDLRSAAEIDGSRREEALNPGEVFEVSEEIKGTEGVLFLRLADGRGWAFDRKPGVGTLCVPHEEKQAATQLRVVVTMHSWQRCDQVPVAPPEFSGLKPGPQETAGWPTLQKYELRPGPERLPLEIEEGSMVLVALMPQHGSIESTIGFDFKLLSWCLGEGTVPGFLEAAVASMRTAESAIFHADKGAALGTQTGPVYDGQTPLRRLVLPALHSVLTMLFDDGEADASGLLECANRGSDVAGCRWPALPECSLPTDWATQGEVAKWDDVGLAQIDGAERSFRLALLAASEAPDVCLMTEEEQQRYLERERAHGNALARLGRFPEASAAYARALDAVRRTSVYKGLFPTERGRIQGAYSRDPGEADCSLELLTKDDMRARRAGLVALHLNLALCAAKQGKATEARRHCTIALSADPDNPKALFRRGSAAMSQGDYQEAMGDLQRAAELQPQDRTIREELQTLQRRMKDHNALEKTMFQNVFKPACRKCTEPKEIPKKEDAQEHLLPK